jgi:hypothetical protein
MPFGGALRHVSTAAISGQEQTVNERLAAFQDALRFLQRHTALVIQLVR